MQVRVCRCVFAPVRFNNLSIVFTNLFDPWPSTGWRIECDAVEAVDVPASGVVKGHHPDLPDLVKVQEDSLARVQGEVGGVDQVHRVTTSVGSIGYKVN